MNVNEAFNILVEVADTAIRKLTDFGINESKNINDAILVLKESLSKTEVLESQIKIKNEAIKRLEEKLKTKK